MNIYPAIYIKDGKCIGLLENDARNVTIYADDPVESAVKWADQGAEYLHVVDVDGSITGILKNQEIIKEIIKYVHIPVQIGGGIRSIEMGQKLLDLGAERIVMASIATEDTELLKHAVSHFGDKLVVQIDVKDKKIVKEGSEQTIERLAVEFAQELEGMGLENIIFRDITRVGSLMGSDIVGITEVLTKVFIDIIVAGGINDTIDLKRLKRLGSSGAIVGKALYTGNIDLSEALDI